jgi:hypothetical protein
VKRRAVLAAPALLLARPAAAAAAKLHNGHVALEIEGEGPEPLLAMIPKWIEKSAEAVSLYYGRFPVPAVRIVVKLQNGTGVRGGKTYPGDPPAIIAPTGRFSEEVHLMEADWVMVHEMIHLAFPDLDGNHRWMHEGIAVYVESIARVQAGHLRPEQIWGDFVSQMPKGLPDEGDGGLDQGDSWGRRYWGGALFCLLADVEIRKRTKNAKGLQHALRGIIDDGRDYRREWPFRETLEVGDRATGETVLADFYDRYRDKPERPRLEALWQELGVSVSGREVSFAADAQLSSIREALTSPLA